MIENTIFENPAPPQAPAETPNPSAGEFVSNQPSPTPVPSTTPLGEAPPNFPGNEANHPRIPFGLIIKAVIGILIVGLIALLTLRFFGSNKSSEKVTLKYWGLWEDAKIMETVISDFQRENPNITIDYSKQDIKDYRDRLTTQILNGNGPDIFRFHNTWLAQVTNIVAPLSKDVISNDDFKKWYYPVVLNDLVSNGAIYGIPLHVDTLALFINTDIFKEGGATAPATWEDFGNVARKLTVKDQNGKIKTAGAALGTFDNINHSPDIIALLMLQNGTDLKKPATSSKNIQDALRFYTLFAMGEDGVWDNTLDPSLLAFARGNLAMYFGFSWDVFPIKAINSQLKFEVKPAPHLPGEKNLTIASYWAEGVSLKSKHQKEAMLFMKFLTKKGVQQKLYAEESKTRLFGELYSRTDLESSLKENVLVYPFVAQAPNALSAYFTSDTADNGLNAKMNEYLGNAVRSILGNTSVESAVETLSSGIQQVLAQYGQQ